MKALRRRFMKSSRTASSPPNSSVRAASRPSRGHGRASGDSGIAPRANEVHGSPTRFEYVRSSSLAFAARQAQASSAPNTAAISPPCGTPAIVERRFVGTRLK